MTVLTKCSSIFLKSMIYFDSPELGLEQHTTPPYSNFAPSTNYLPSLIFIRKGENPAHIRIMNIMNTVLILSLLCTRYCAKVFSYLNKIFMRKVAYLHFKDEVQRKFAPNHITRNKQNSGTQDSPSLKSHSCSYTTYEMYIHSKRNAF